MSGLVLVRWVLGMRYFANNCHLLRLDMRNFTLSSKAGCLVDSFQIITSEQTNLHHHQAQAATLTRLCGERRKTTGII